MKNIVSHVCFLNLIEFNVILQIIAHNGDLADRPCAAKY